MRLPTLPTGQRPLDTDFWTMHFNLRAFSSATGLQTLHWEAASEAEVLTRAAREGLDIIELRTGIDSSPNIFRKHRFPSRQFSQEVVALNEAGFSLVEILETLLSNEKNSLYRNIVSGILSRLKAGEPFSQALAAFPEHFSSLFIETVRASEQTGDITRALRRYIEYEEQVDTLKNHIIAASVYPLLLIFSGFVVVVFMLGYVVPRLAGAYENVRGQAPALSQLLFAWGEIVNENGTLVASGAGIAIVLIAYTFLHASRRNHGFHLGNHLPFLGEQIRTYHLARLYRTTGMLLAGGTPLVSALSMARGILPATLQPALDAARREITQGLSLAQAFETSGLATPVATRMFRVAERSGELASVMERIAAFHDDRLAQGIKRLIRVFEPLLMVFIGTVIGGIVILMYMPIFELAGSIG